MRSLVISCSAVILFCNVAFAYQIRVKEYSSNEYVNGKLTKKGVTYATTYDVDESQGTVTNLSAIAKIQGKKYDTASGQEKEIYKIWYKKDGNLTAVREYLRGEELISFKNDGKFVYFNNLYFPENVGAFKVKGLYTIVSFGEWVLIPHTGPRPEGTR